MSQTEVDINTSVEQEKKLRDPYKTSRVMYMLEAAFEYFISILTSGTYLAKLTTSIGISDSMTAVLSTIVSLAASFQIISIFLSHTKHVKRLSILMTSVQLLNSILYLIPFIAIGESLTGVIFFITMLFIRIVSSVLSPIKQNWYMGLVEPKKCGSFTATLQCVSLVGGMIFTFVIGVIIDSYEANGNIKGAFVLLSVMIFVLAILQLLTIVFSKEKPSDERSSAQKASPLSEVKGLWKNKKYVRLLIVNIIWSLATNLSLPFYGTYQINELGFSMTTISILSITLSLVQLAAVTLFGRLSVIRPCLTILKIGYPLSVLSYAVMIFTVPSNGLWMFIIHRVLTLIGGCAITVGGTITYHITNYRERTSALAINMIATGFVGFTVTLLATMIFDYVKTTLGSKMFGMTVYAQQFLSAITVAIGVILIVYLYTFFSKAINAKESREEAEF